MSYGNAADEERLLSHTRRRKEMMQSTSQVQSLPSSSNISPQSGVSLSTAPSTTTPNSFLSYERVASYAQQTWQECRQWKEFFSTRALSVPQFVALSDRLSTNLYHYRANYQVIIAFWLSIILLTTLTDFLLTCILFFILERYCSRQANKNGGQLQNRDILITVFVSLFIIWITGIGIHIAIALCLSTISVGIHATFHTPDFIETEIATV